MLGFSIFRPSVRRDSFFSHTHTLVLALSQIGMVPRFEHLINVVVKMSSAVFVTVGESHIVLSRLNY